MTAALRARLRPLRRVPAELSTAWGRIPEPARPCLLLISISLIALAMSRPALRSWKRSQPVRLMPLAEPTPTSWPASSSWNGTTVDIGKSSALTSDASSTNGTKVILPDVSHAFGDVAAETMMIGGEVILPSMFGVPELDDAGRDAAIQLHDVRLRTIESTLAHVFARERIE